MKILGFDTDQDKIDAEEEFEEPKSNSFEALVTFLFIVIVCVVLFKYALPALDYLFGFTPDI